MNKEFYDKDVAINWADDASETESLSIASFSNPREPSSTFNTWNWKTLSGDIPYNVKERIRNKGMCFSTTANLVHPIDGKSLGVKATDKNHPYYVVLFNPGGGFKHTCYKATTCPEEYVAYMKLFDATFKEKENQDYSEWMSRRDAYFKSCSKN